MLARLRVSIIRWDFAFYLICQQIDACCIYILAYCYYIYISLLWCEGSFLIGIYLKKFRGTFEFFFIILWLLNNNNGHRSRAYQLDRFMNEIHTVTPKILIMGGEQNKKKKINHLWHSRRKNCASRRYRQEWLIKAKTNNIYFHFNTTSLNTCIFIIILSVIIARKYRRNL